MAIVCTALRSRKKNCYPEKMKRSHYDLIFVYLWRKTKKKKKESESCDLSVILSDSSRSLRFIFH